MSGASMVSIERIARVDPANTWFQLYAARDPKISDDFLRRARDAGFGTLVLTVDNPVLPKRERDMRNGFRLPPKLAPLDLLEALRHLPWVIDYFRHGGMPLMETWAPYASPGADAAAVARYFRTQSPSIQTWRDLDTFRRVWPGKLVVKGIMRPSDAVRCAELGVDGIVISNHGGKALDRAPASIEVLPAIKAAVGGRHRGHARQRRSPRLRHYRRALPRRRFRLSGTRAALWRGRRWIGRRHPCARYLA